MTTKKHTRRKKAARPAKTARKKKAPRAAKKKIARKAPAAKNELASKRKAARRNKIAQRNRLARGVPSSGNAIAVMRKGPGSGTGGQSGDIQGLSNVEGADSESVEELIEDGQAYEAGIIDGIENAPDADQGEVKTREVPEDDLPPRRRSTL